MIIKNFLRFLNCAVVGLFLIMLIPSCSNGLTKNEATKAFTKSEEFNKIFGTVYFFLRVGTHEENCSPYNQYSESTDDSYFFFEKKIPIFERLEQAGFISLDKSVGKMRCQRGMEGKIVNVTLTEKGKNVFTHAKDDYWKAEICKSKFIAVKNISKYADKPITFEVSYTWKYECNDLANIVKPISFGLYNQADLDSIFENNVWLYKSQDTWAVMSGQPLRKR